MKRGFYIFAMLLTIATTSTSCMGDKDKNVSSALVGVVTGDTTLGSYVVFESGQKGLITKGHELVNNIPDSAYYPDKSTGEARALIYYSSEFVNDVFFDGKVEIEALNTIDIQLTDIRLDESIAEKYKDDISITGAGITYTRNRYVNLQMFYHSADAFFDNEHKFRLVYNTERNGYFAELYPATDDGYLYLELYHDAGSDAGGNNYRERIMSFYLDDLMVGRHITSEYQGIKILYRDGSVARKVEYKFAK